MEKKIILDHSSVLMKVQRMAWQVYENNIEAQSIIVAGIKGCGENLSILLADELEKIAQIKVIKVTVGLDKQNPTIENVQVNLDLNNFKDSPVVVVDDVLNSGRTLSYAVFPFLSNGFKKIQTAVLVNRNHRNFPIAADFSGISLATTLQEHIEVLFENNEYEVSIK
ncbi:MAG: phosphoribosyltransferase [Bacteroidetes bacterium]|nr:phosphoribosyltransferase [Bacteroidota bacterium]